MKKKHFCFFKRTRNLREKMGLASKLGQVNNATTQQLASAKAPVADGGFNHTNVPSVPASMPLTGAEAQDIQQVRLAAQADVANKARTGMNTLGLVKPNVPSGPQYPCQEVSGLVVEKMWRIVCLKNLFPFYTQEQLQALVDRACRHDYRVLQKQWNLPTIDMTVDLAVLGLYDIVVFADDSGSMTLSEPKEDNLSRFHILKQVLKTVGFWASLMDSDGIMLRFFNSMEKGDGLGSMADIETIVSRVQPRGGTPMGENLQAKILDQIVYPVMRAKNLGRPVLIITLTDGTPGNEQSVIDTIVQCKAQCATSKYGENAVAFAFAQIGSDTQATTYLGVLDKHPLVGHLIDCTSEFSIEQKECGAGFTEAVWVVKTMIGAVDPAYDTSDEQQQPQPSAPHMQQQQYYPPPQQYQQQQYYQQPPPPYYPQQQAPPTGYPQQQTW